MHQDLQALVEPDGLDLVSFERALFNGGDRARERARFARASLEERRHVPVRSRSVDDELDFVPSAQNFVRRRDWGARCVRLPICASVRFGSGAPVADADVVSARVRRVSESVGRPGLRG